MPLADDYLPHFQFSERHARHVPALPPQVMAAVRRYRPEQDAFFRRMIALRELPARLRHRWQAPTQPMAAPFGLDNFTLLAEHRDGELAYGLIGRFWAPDYGLVSCRDGHAFRAFAEPGVARLLLTFTAQQTGSGTRLATEMRICCSDRASLLRFAPYWYLIRPVSGLIRRRILSAISRDCA